MYKLFEFELLNEQEIAMMKNIISSLLCCLSLVFATASAQTEVVEKKALTAENLAGKTFTFIDGSWGWHAVYFRPDGTFKICGSLKIGCDEGTWFFEGGKVVRVFKVWFAKVNHRPTPLILTIDGEKGTYGSLSARVYLQEEAMPNWIAVDPRK